MTWEWTDFAEWEQEVRPYHIDSAHRWRSETSGSRFEQLERLAIAAESLYGVRDKGRQLLKGRDKREKVDGSFVREARDLVLEATLEAEHLLLRHRRLAVSHWSRHFLNEACIAEPETWEHVSTRKPLIWELGDFFEALDELLTGYRRLKEDDSELFRSLGPLPPSAERELESARDLFSTGFDSMGLLATGKAMEAVLREVAVTHSLSVRSGKRRHSSDALSFYDLVEAFGQFRRDPQGDPLLGREDRQLLHFLREMRNMGAHPGAEERARPRSHREQAIVVADMCHDVWARLGSDDLQLQTATIEKNW